jgi:hypothetical protein
VEGFLTLAVASSFGLWVTVHLTLARAVGRATSLWPALLGLLVPPAAFVLALRAGLGFRALVWAACLALYLTLLMLAR